MTSRFRFRLITGLAIAGAITACVVDPLNPQPLPPNPENGATFHADSGAVVSFDGGSTKSGGDAAAATDPNAHADSGSGPPLDDDDDVDAGDGGDAADAKADG